MSDIRLVARLESGAVLLIAEKPDGICLYSFAPDSATIFDTCHRTIQEAKEQAIYQFEWPEDRWVIVPPEIADPVKFARDISN